ncbi:MAG: uroporphyrinogen decarboxylase family protein [Thermoguttaceae bacterium]|jgi:uroporphyrinogen decarboxylase|nr:uroporphyrinogen decarboxylase family protein [Thermoguttaceae bacterium]
MKPIERINAVRAGQVVDHWPFVPSIYEHGARLLDRSPGEVSRSAELMAEAALTAFDTYRHDLVTVGIDIYNVEAEAFGCRLSEGAGKSIPGVTNHPLAGGPLDPRDLAIPQPAPGNRLGLMVDAVERVIREIGDEVWVYACTGGPFSQAAELRGFENLVIDMYEAPEQVHALLDKTATLATEHACRLAALGAGVNLFESWATLPLIDPPIYEQYVVPYNKRVIDAVRSQYQTPPPAVILGGDTTRLIDYFIATGTGLVAADYLADIGHMRKRIGDRPIIIRGCVDPKMIEWGDWQGLEQMLRKLAEKAAGMTRFVWGCGCVSYDTPPESLLRLKEMALAADARVRA